MTGILSRLSFLSSSERKAKNVVKVSDEPPKEIEVKDLIVAKRSRGSSRKDGKKMSSSAEILHPVAKPVDPFAFDDSLKCLTPRASIANDGVELLRRKLAERKMEEQTEQQTERHRDSNVSETDFPQQSGNHISFSPQILTCESQEERQDDRMRRPLKELFDQRQTPDAG